MKERRREALEGRDSGLEMWEIREKERQRHTQRERERERERERGLN